MEQVILVNEQDIETGVMDKMEVHEKGLLHRAFSVFVFNKHNEILMQQRAIDKYHSGGLWTNSCCSHPRPGESTHDAASRRLQEEMGFATALQEIFSFIYQAGFSNGLVEHEFDHVLIGHYDGEVRIDHTEVGNYGWWPVQTIEKKVQRHPEEFTAWFLVAFPKIRAWLASRA